MSEIKRKRRMKKELLCRYCDNFWHAIKRYATKIGVRDSDNIIHERVCLEGSKIRGSKIACELFIPVSLFWCDRSEHWVQPEVCLHRREIRRSGCVTCKQFKKHVELYIEKVKERGE